MSRPLESPAAIEMEPIERELASPYDSLPGEEVDIPQLPSTSKSHQCNAVPHPSGDNDPGAEGPATSRTLSNLILPPAESAVTEMEIRRLKDEIDFTATLDDAPRTCNSRETISCTQTHSKGRSARMPGTYENSVSGCHHSSERIAEEGASSELLNATMLTQNQLTISGSLRHASAISRCSKSARGRGPLKEHVKLTELFHVFVLWISSIVLGAVAVSFGEAGKYAQDFFSNFIKDYPKFIFFMSPLGFTIIVGLVFFVFPGTGGSGIPLVMYALPITLNDPDISPYLSLRIIIGKYALTLCGFMCGASIGREGPTVQISASILVLFITLADKYVPLNDFYNRRKASILAGGAAGIASAFNTPVGGIVFAIEEMGHEFNHVYGEYMIIAVTLSGLTALFIVGFYDWFGHISATLPTSQYAEVILWSGTFGGILGGLFSRFTIVFVKAKMLSRTYNLYSLSPFIVAFSCGMGVAFIGYFNNNSTYGSGYGPAKLMVEGSKQTEPLYFGVMKGLATFVSFASGIPGGIFAPSLSSGAGWGLFTHTYLFPDLDQGSIVLCVMVSYFSGVTQSPITSFVIVQEMADQTSFLPALMACSLLATIISRFICPKPLYAYLASLSCPTCANVSPDPDTGASREVELIGSSTSTSNYQDLHQNPANTGPEMVNDQINTGMPGSNSTPPPATAAGASNGYSSSAHEGAAVAGIDNVTAGSNNIGPRADGRPAARRRRKWITFLAV